MDGVISIFHNHPDYKEAVLGELARFERVVYYEKPGSDDNAMPVGACCVTPDYYAVGRLGVEHLIDRQRRRIALVLNDLVFPYAQARHRAYKDALKAAGREVDERLIGLGIVAMSLFWTPGLAKDVGPAPQGMTTISDPVYAWGELINRCRLPLGFVGLLVAVEVAAYMSTLSSLINWGSSFVVNDLLATLCPDQSPKRQVWISRLTTLVLFAADWNCWPTMPAALSPH